MLLFMRATFLSIVVLFVNCVDNVPISLEHVSQEILLTEIEVDDYLVIKTHDSHNIQGNFVMLDATSIVIKNLLRKEYRPIFQYRTNSCSKAK